MRLVALTHYRVNRTLGRGLRPIQRNPDPVQDRSMYILLPCLRESAVISYPIRDWAKHYRIQNNKNVHKAHEISESYVIEGGGEE